MKKTLSTILLVSGAALFVFGSYAARRAAFAEGRISQAESTGQGRPTLGPVRRAVKTQQAEEKQTKLAQEGLQVVASQVTANWLRGIGIVLFIAGVGGFFFWAKKKR